MISLLTEARQWKKSTIKKVDIFTLRTAGSTCCFVVVVVVVVVAAEKRIG
jgi:hypothetical protein